MTRSSFWLILSLANARLVTIEEDNQKNVNRDHLRRKVTNEDTDLTQPRLQRPQTGNQRASQKIEKDKVSSLLGGQRSETNSQFGAVYRITCWDSSANERAGCIYQAPNKFVRGGVSHFWLRSSTHTIRWIHFYDANVVPTNSLPYKSDYAITHTNLEFQGIDFVNFIVMFEPTGEDVPSTPSDHEWIVYSDPSERWNTALSSFPSNYEGERARSNIRTAQGNFSPENIVLVTFPSIVRNLHFDDVEGMIVTGIEGDFAQVVTLTNIPQYVKQIWFDFEYLDAYRGEGQLDPVQNWFDATMTSVNIY